MPRRGYRFIAPVQPIEAEEAVKEDAEPAPPAVVAPRRYRWLVLAALGVGMLLWWGVWRRERTLTLSAPTQLTRDTGLNTDPVISRDGKLLAYASDRAGENNLDIWVQHLPAGEPRRLDGHVADDHEPDISPDGSEIIFRSEREGGGVYAVSTLGGDPRLLIPGAFVPRFSPDGTHIAYARGTFGTGAFTGELFVHDWKTGANRSVAPDIGILGAAAWSPDGKLLAFVGEKLNDDVHGVHLWICDAGGGGATLLWPEPLSGPSIYFGQLRTMSVAWFGKWLVLARSQGDSVNLWAGAVSTPARRIVGEWKRLTVGSGNEVMPSIAANGKMVFASRVDSAAIWEADPAKGATAMRRLTNDRARNFRPSLSADGLQLAYVSDRSGNFDVWLRDLTTNTEHVVARTVVRDLYAVLSRDGSEVGSWDGTDTYLMPTRGGTPRQLCQKCGRPEGWTASGKLVEWNEGIAVRDTATGAVERLADDTEHPPIAPALSPDGKWFAFHVLDARRGAQGRRRRQVFLVPNTGKPVQRSEWLAVTDGNGLDREARWSGSGKRVYFLSDRDGFRCIWAREFDPAAKRLTGEIFPAMHLHDARLSLSHIANTGHVGMTAHGENLIFSVGEMTGDIWAADLHLR